MLLLELVLILQQINAKVLKKELRNDDQAPLCGVSNVRSGSSVNGHSAGRHALRGEFPWQVSIQLHDPLATEPEHEYEHACGGTLISESHVLTAAHCIHEYDNNADVRVAAGGLQYRSSENLRKVSKIIFHQNFDPISLDNDIGILKLAESLDFVGAGGNLNAACLPHANLHLRDYIRGNLTTCGWGAGRDVGDFSEQLQAVDVPLVDYNRCVDLYGEGVVSDGMICAGLIEDDRESCSGDAGGPLLGHDSDLRAIVVGIVSWGYGCSSTGYPAVYTHVTKYIDWILKHAD